MEYLKITLLARHRQTYIECYDVFPLVRSERCDYIHFINRRLRKNANSNPTGPGIAWPVPFAAPTSQQKKWQVWTMNYIWGHLGSSRKFQIIQSKPTSPPHMVHLCASESATNINPHQPTSTNHSSLDPAVSRVCVGR